jgi:hypothetical protein
LFSIQQSRIKRKNTIFLTIVVHCKVCKYIVIKKKRSFVSVSNFTTVILANACLRAIQRLKEQGKQTKTAGQER